MTLPAALNNGNAMSNVSNSETRLKATFRVKLNGKTVAIETVGQAYDFITSLNSVEWMEFKSLHSDAKAALEAAADNAHADRAGDQRAPRPVRARKLL